MKGDTQLKLPKRRRKRAIWITSACFVVVASFISVSNARVLASVRSNVYLDAASIPHHRVGIVLGCAPTHDSYPSPYFIGRINAAARLYKAGKVDRLLVSGDNGMRGYDEPTAMREALIAKGVPPDRITMDCAGFRTLDSMVRAKKVFGLNDASIITDDFHMARSLYLADGAGLKADGFPSMAAANLMTRSSEFREVLARSRAVLDQDILHTGPKFLGKQAPIL